VGPELPGRGGVGSPTWSQLWEDEGATPALADVETETELLTKRKEVRTRGDEHPDQESDPSVLRAALEGNQERAMVRASRPSRSTSGSVAEWVWPDPGKPGEA
jgi:hypothetical protein